MPGEVSVMAHLHDDLLVLRGYHYLFHGCPWSTCLGVGWRQPPPTQYPILEIISGRGTCVWCLALSLLHQGLQSFVLPLGLNQCLPASPHFTCGQRR
ncbi:hypothetical protein E2C01_076668 [Portunus trituberculatus]|uniref:Uncharacterized protein n=1 Tax=Portunus trituberculatus TaxID=210409 RepID=A0A5B7IIC5_PORTR|nr:hypothetical protein [Portunus trituberculatus]